MWACPGGSNEVCEGHRSCQEVRSPGGQERGGTGMTAGTAACEQPSPVVALVSDCVPSHSAVMTLIRSLPLLG